MFSLYYFLMNKGAFTQILKLSQIVIDHMKVVSKAYKQVMLLDLRGADCWCPCCGDLLQVAPKVKH